MTHRSRGRRFSVRGRRRAVSDVVATILLLALTVTLFASIFFFVTSFPSPPAQNSNQFQGSIQLAANGSYIKSVSILHLGGPVVPGTDDVYLKGSVQPSYPSFSTPITISSGIGGGSSWNLGQTWTYTFPNSPPSNPQPRLQNVTVYVVSPTQLLYSAVLPGQSIGTPPAIVNDWISPTSPTTGTAYTIYAVFSGSLSSNPTITSASATSGLPTTPTAMSSTGLPTNEYSYTVPAGATANGTYYAVISGTNYLGTGTGALQFIVLSSTASSPLTVSVSLTTTPPLMAGTSTSAPSLNLEAAVTYTGSLSGASLNVSFYVNQTTPSKLAKYTGYGPQGLTISGVSTVTAYSTTKFSLPDNDGPRTYVVVASATVGGTVSSQGNLTIAVPLGIGTSNSTTPKAGTGVTFMGKLYLNTTAYGAGPFTWVGAATGSYGIWLNYTSNNTVAKEWTLTSSTISPGTPVAFQTSSTFVFPTVTHAPTYTYSLTVAIYVTGIGAVWQSYDFSVVA
jgi:FlaG/FlaF family flagellin (archaellin)